MSSTLTKGTHQVVSANTPHLGSLIHRVVLFPTYAKKTIEVMIVAITCRRVQLTHGELASFRE